MVKKGLKYPTLLQINVPTKVMILSHIFLRWRVVFFTGRVIYFKKGHSFVTNNGDEILIMCTNPKQGDDKF